MRRVDVEIPSRKLPCLPSFLCPPLPQPIPNHSIVISIKKVCISLDATTLITNYLFVPCTMYHVPCIMYSVPGTTYPVPCTMYYVPCTPNKMPTLPTCLGLEGYTNLIIIFHCFSLVALTLPPKQHKDPTLPTYPGFQGNTVLTFAFYF